MTDRRAWIWSIWLIESPHLGSYNTTRITHTTPQSEFLRLDANKAELSIPFASTDCCRNETDKQVITAHNVDVLCSISRVDVSGLAPWTNEEADTGIQLHLEDVVKQGHNEVLIRSVDADVVVLAVTAGQRLNIGEFWVVFGVGKNFRYVAAHEISRALGPDRCVALLMFHAFTGCDKVSYFGGRGKRVAWETWNGYGDISAALSALAARPSP
ncbi:hypothetical protein Hamer_G017505 [Homarus americanus]|uniref:Uncharacterized protein n=1 Tax=Homarus americanus TaxID=6706 RepID=A0A8J5JPR6_HOMAM|nr:hypothetical protein Hamer_G017505 [Homarus americanus]